MEERNFYKSGKISDYLFMKEKGKRGKERGGAYKGKGSCDKTGQLRGL